ncbi:MAG: FliA/WhiG family RNA polymerase sigma factor [Syntrophales bacterium]|nr:FliA/WhiG family RNA polymerase sigma factor [Syntrophales bacterium]HPL62849.1 FliA/WhiG family RNA polymerase sigma factor [Syntrophales bacterium]
MNSRQITTAEVSSSSPRRPSTGDDDKKKRDELILKYAPLVKSIVDRVAAKVPPHIAAKEDLINVGVIGLISALSKFDEKRNVQFETYARYRIRGAVLDELRARDWVPRSTRSKNARLEEAFQRLQKELGRPPDDREVSLHLNVSLEEYYEMLEEARGVTLLSSEDLPPDYCEKYSSREVMEGIEQGNPLSLLAKRELKEVLKKSIDSLPEKEKLVLSLYYYEELTMKEIGLILKLTESRVCQLHSKAILRLRGELNEKRL